MTVIDVKRLTPVQTISLGERARPMGTAMAPDGAYLYVTTGRSRMVLIVETATNRIVGSIDVGPRPWGIALAPDGSTLFTANGPSNDVSVIEVASRRVSRKISVGRGPWGVVVVKKWSAALRR